MQSNDYDYDNLEKNGLPNKMYTYVFEQTAPRISYSNKNPKDEQ